MVYEIVTIMKRMKMGVNVQIQTDNNTYDS